MCTLPETSRHYVLVSLLTELLFISGEETTIIAEAVPRLYQEHFGCDLQLECFGVDTLSGLLLLPKISDFLRLQVSTCQDSLIYLYSCTSLASECDNTG